MELGARIWRCPPQDVTLSNSSSRSDSRGSLCFKLFVLCGLSISVSNNTLTTGFICSLGSASNYSNLMPIRPAKARRHQLRMIRVPTDGRQTAECLFSSFGSVHTGSHGACLFRACTYARSWSWRKQNVSCQENEDQRLFRLSLIRELSCNNQGRRSERTILPDQLWARSVGVRILIILPHPPSLRNMFYRLSFGLFERFSVLKRLVDAEIDWIEDDAV